MKISNTIPPTTPTLTLRQVTLVLSDGRVVDIPIERIREVTLSMDSRMEQERLLKIVLEFGQFLMSDQTENKADRGALMDANP